MNSSLTKSVVISSTGQIQSAANVTATSGYWRDIQTAVDWIASSGGVGNVYIPEGTFNFVNVGESWTGARVVIPLGVNILGAPTQRDANNQVIQWETVLIMPYEVPTSGPDNRPRWFQIQGNGNPDISFRFSDIELVGYREFDSTSITGYTGIWIGNVQNFRVDHSSFKNLAGTAILATASGGVINGVIDHNRLVNDVGLTGYGPEGYNGRTLGYGIAVYGANTWPDLSSVLGQATDYTVFIEDNYFSKWRHGISSNYGAHYVARYNTIQYDYGHFSFDVHGSNQLGSIGTRATEFYNNTFIDPEAADLGLGCIQVTGGGGVVFNNTAVGWHRLVYLSDRAGTTQQTMVNGFYVWSNSLTNVNNEVDAYAVGIPILQDVHYFLYEMPNYTPYTYPHPLTLEAAT